MRIKLLLPALVMLALQSCTEKTKIKPVSESNGANPSLSITAIGNTGQFATFSITNKDAAKVLEIGNYSLANGGKTYLGDFAGTGVGNNNKKWKIRNAGGGYYT
ncbi:MAG: hypothetical protein EOP51_17975, partial [Sphingobacteriales bacterium]